jgi:hypothetical protein
LYLWINKFSIFGFISVQHKEPPIGSVVKFSRDIRYKNKQMIGWRNIEKRMKLYEGDSVFSGVDSEVVINLNNKSVIFMRPNSLISFPFTENTNLSQLQIDYGNLDLSMDPGHPTEIRSDSGKIIIGSVNSLAKINLNFEAGARIKVVSGQAQVTAGGVEKKVTADMRVLQIDPNSTLREIVNEENSVDSGDLSSTEDSDLQNNAPSEVAFSPLPSISQLPISIVPSQTPVPLDKKIFAEKLKPKKAKNIPKKIVSPSVQSPTPSLNPQSLVVPKAPNLIEPLDRATLYYPKSEPLLVSFGWYNVVGAESFIIQISKQREFKTLICEEKTKIPTFKYKFKESVKIYWRVKSLSQSKESDWSLIRTSNVTHDN